jgi:RNA polymerase sigma factor (TIGR02999 family)
MILQNSGRATIVGDLFTDTGDIGAPSEVRKSATQLLPLFYDEVRRVARRERRRMGAGETMQTTALINEAYLKLNRGGTFNDRAHFLRSAAMAMRHSLINYARDRIAAKRGSGAPVVSIDEVTEHDAPAVQELLDINDAIGRLAQLSPRLAQIVECRFFAGYSDQETAQALGITDRTVRRDWIKARAWLHRELAGSHTSTSL